MELNRRAFLAAAAATLVAGPGVTQAQNAYTFTPDAHVPLAGNSIPIDLALLGPNGEATAGFYAALDPFHGTPFEPGWRAVYDYYLNDNPWDTDEAVIERVLTHIEVHGISRAEVLGIYEQAKAAWDAKPGLRANIPEPVNGG